MEKEDGNYQYCHENHKDLNLNQNGNKNSLFV